MRLIIATKWATRKTAAAWSQCKTKRARKYCSTLSKRTAQRTYGPPRRRELEASMSTPRVSIKNSMTAHSSGTAIKTCLIRSASSMPTSISLVLSTHLASKTLNKRINLFQASRTPNLKGKRWGFDLKGLLFPRQ